MVNPVIFKEYDIRGIVGEQFDDRFAYELGKSFVSYLKKFRNINNPTVSVGFDARLSSPSLANSLVRGLKESGASVFRLGLVTTPISYFSTRTIPDISGAIMITGSHNPPEYNGFKISAGSSAIFGEEIQKVRKIYEEKDFLDGTGTVEDFDIMTPYVEKYAAEFKNLPQVPIVFDCGNGAAGSVLRRLLEKIGFESTILFEEPDGHFPNHHPDPTVEKYMKELSDTVKTMKSAAGIGFDGDADRIGVVDENGRLVLGDELMVMFSRGILEDLPGSLIIGDVKCSDRLYSDIEAHGGKPLMWMTGHSLIKEKIKVDKAPFGGEMSGHVCFADRNFGYDDAIYAALRLIELLGRKKKPVSSLLEGLPTAFNTPEIRIDTTE
ncbi:MAG: phosphomannomutase/phosphoglucomutase, partial [Bdellovibrionales bacterium]|nr:phosphomannomutase/phosphoglucomutase [Bdellovibrionales bacterium]